MSFGSLIAFLVLMAAFVLYLMDRMDGTTAAMFAGLALAILLSAFPLKLRVPA